MSVGCIGKTDGPAPEKSDWHLRNINTNNCDQCDIGDKSMAHQMKLYLLSISQNGLQDWPKQQ